MKHEQLEREAEPAIRQCLADVPFVEVVRTEMEPEEPWAGTWRPDLLAELKLPDGDQTLVVEVKSSGQPRVIREAANQLFRYRQLVPDAYGVVVAPYVSPEGAEICSREGVGYVDLAGNCRLSFGRVYIRREGNPNPFAIKRDLRSLYSPKAERVLRVLLTDANQKWKVQELADQAEVSLGQVSNVKKLLADREWIQAATDGFSLTQPEQLLAEWATNDIRRRDDAADFYSLESANDVEYALADACREQGIRCALTAFAGAARFAPMVRYQRATAYVERDVDQIARRLDLKRVPSGANVRLIVPRDEGVFYGTRDVGGAPVASPVQIYLDLLRQRGRGEEAANALLEEVIKPRWERSA